MDKDRFVRDLGDTSGHGKMLKRATCRRDTKSYNFTYRSRKTLNNLDTEMVLARNIQKF